MPRMDRLEKGMWRIRIPDGADCLQHVVREPQYIPQRLDAQAGSIRDLSPGLP